MGASICRTSRRPSDAKRKNRSAAGHTGHADFESRRTRAHPRLRDLAAHSADLQRRALCAARLVVSGLASPREARMADRRLGRVGERTASQVLPPVCQRPAATHDGRGNLAQTRASHSTGPERRPAGGIMPGRRPFLKGGQNRDHDLDREIAFHVEELTQANIAQGMHGEEARRQAILAFGGHEQIKQSLREVHSSALLESIIFNLKAAIRFMRRSPSFSATVIFILAIGIGLNSAVFSAIDAVVLRPLPFPDGDQLVALYQQDVKNRDANHFVAPARLEDWNRMNSTFQGISGYYLDDLSETTGPLPEKVTEALVAPRFLQVMGVAPMLGRDFRPEEEHFGGPDAVLISYRFWQRRFHGASDVFSRKLHVGSFAYSIVGVMPPSFVFPNRAVYLWA